MKNNVISQHNFNKISTKILTRSRRCYLVNTSKFLVIMMSFYSVKSKKKKKLLCNPPNYYSIIVINLSKLVCFEETNCCFKASFLSFLMDLNSSFFMPKDFSCCSKYKITYHKPQ